MPVSKFDFSTCRSKAVDSSAPSRGSRVVALFVYEGRDFPPMDRNGLGDFYVKFKLGGKKYRTSVVYESLSPRWMENIDVFAEDADDNELQIAVWDFDRGMRDDYVGSTTVNLAAYDDEDVHDLWIDIYKDGVPKGSVHLSLIITGRKISKEDSTEVDCPTGKAVFNKIEELKRYSLENTCRDPKDVGVLTVKVYKGSGLRAADLNGKSDPFCVLQLGDMRFQTQVVSRTLNPEWNQTFTFPVTDVHSVLRITVLDMDKKRESDFLGRIAVPLLNAYNGKQWWYALKDSDLTGRAAGSILVELDLIYNPIRAGLASISPNESQLDEVCEKFNRRVFLGHVSRLRPIIMSLLETVQYIKDCLNWKSYVHSSAALSAYLIAVCYVQLWMLPFGLLLFFLKGYIAQQALLGISEASTFGLPQLYENDSFDVDDDDDNDSPDSRSSSRFGKNLLVGMRFAKSHLSTAQSVLGKVADTLERVNNTAQFVVPWLSWMGVAGLVLATVVCYLLPFRAVLFLFGVHVFSKKLRKGYAWDYEIFDFLSRVYTDEEVRMYRELRVKELPLAEALMSPKSSLHISSKRKPDKYRWDDRKQ